MRKHPHNANLPLVLARIILCCSCFFFINCTSENEFERDVPFHKNWESENGLSYKKNFEFELRPNKIYFLQLFSKNNIPEVRVNNTIVQVNEKNGSGIYNITEHLKEHNTIEIKTREFGEMDQLKAKLHCVNKIYIPKVDLELYEIENAGKSLRIEVKIKNSFNIEKQGYLKYYLYSEKDEVITERETPVFIEGNAENMYRQQIDINTHSHSAAFKIVCNLFVEGEELDEYIKHIKLN